LKILALLFFIFILIIIVGADNGTLSTVLHGIYDFPGADKIGHVGLYGVMSFLLARAFPQPFKLRRISIPVSVIALLIFATVEEYTQQFFSTRTADLIDLTCSFLGIAAGAWLASLRK
jgi:VanZ family protein